MSGTSSASLIVARPGLLSPFKFSRMFYRSTARFRPAGLRQKSDHDRLPKFPSSSSQVFSSACCQCHWSPPWATGTVFGAKPDPCQ
eukprot:664315-Hanusia_phi.AAC.2